MLGSFIVIVILILGVLSYVNSIGDPILNGTISQKKICIAAQANGVWNKNPSFFMSSTIPNYFALRNNSTAMKSSKSSRTDKIRILMFGDSISRNAVHSACDYFNETASNFMNCSNSGKDGLGFHYFCNTPQLEIASFFIFGARLVGPEEPFHTRAQRSRHKCNDMPFGSLARVNDYTNNIKFVFSGEVQLVVLNALIWNIADLTMQDFDDTNRFSTFAENYVQNLTVLIKVIKASYHDAIILLQKDIPPYPTNKQDVINNKNINKLNKLIDIVAAANNDVCVLNLENFVRGFNGSPFLGDGKHPTNKISIEFVNLLFNIVGRWKKNIIPVNTSKEEEVSKSHSLPVKSQSIVYGFILVDLRAANSTVNHRIITLIKKISKEAASIPIELWIHKQMLLPKDFDTYSQGVTLTFLNFTLETNSLRDDRSILTNSHIAKAYALRGSMFNTSIFIDSDVWICPGFYPVLESVLRMHPANKVIWTNASTPFGAYLKENPLLYVSKEEIDPVRAEYARFHERNTGTMLIIRKCEETQVFLSRVIDIWSEQTKNGTIVLLGVDQGAFREAAFIDRHAISEMTLAPNIFCRDKQFYGNGCSCKSCVVVHQPSFFDSCNTKEEKNKNKNESKNFSSPYQQAPLVRNKQVNIKLLHFWGRFGNAIIELAHAATLAFCCKGVLLTPNMLLTKEEAIFPKLLPSVDFSSNSYAHNKSTEKICLTGFSGDGIKFFYHQKIKPCAGYDEFSIIRKILNDSAFDKTKSFDDKRKDLVIHIRSGDIFDNKSYINTYYTQPPTHFYTTILQRNWTTVTFVTSAEPIEMMNPIWAFFKDKFRDDKRYFFQNANSESNSALREDLIFLMRAQYFVSASSTLSEFVINYSINLKEYFCTDTFYNKCSTVLPPNKRLCNKVRLKNYSFEKWTNSINQRQFMLTYNGTTTIQSLVMDKFYGV